MGTSGSSLSAAPRTEPPLREYRPREHAAAPEESVVAPVATPPCPAPITMRSAPAQRYTPPGLRRTLRAGCAESGGIGTEPWSTASSFAERVLRLALEVLDRRRPVTQLCAVAEPRARAAIGTLLAEGLIPGRELGTAVLARVDIAMVHSTAAEVFASYDRGDQHFAIAARIVRTRQQWRLAVFRVR